MSFYNTFEVDENGLQCFRKSCKKQSNTRDQGKGWVVGNAFQARFELCTFERGSGHRFSLAGFHSNFEEIYYCETSLFMEMEPGFQRIEERKLLSAFQPNNKAIGSEAQTGLHD